MDLYCQAEAAVLLASYAIQASFGDADDAIELNLEKLLPTSVINHYELSPSM
jgi:merlin protein